MALDKDTKKSIILNRLHTYQKQEYDIKLSIEIFQETNQDDKLAVSNKALLSTKKAINFLKEKLKELD